jgi:hypothetical protein
VPHVSVSSGIRSGESTVHLIVEVVDERPVDRAAAIAKLRSATSEMHFRSSGRLLPARDDGTNDERFASAYHRGVPMIRGQSPAARVYSM